MEKNEKKKGIFYAVSTGPGDPDMMTMQAVKVLSKSEIIFYPQTTGGQTDCGKNSLSFDTAEDAVDMRNKILIPADFSMNGDMKSTALNYQVVAGSCLDYLSQGKDVAFISLGDVSLYSTSAHIASIIKSQGFEVVFIPGVTSISASACACALDLAGRDTPVTIIPGDALFSDGMLKAELESPGTKIIMKSGHHLQEIIKMIHMMGITERCSIVQNCSLPEQKIIRGSEIDSAGNDFYLNSYLSVLIVLEEKTADKKISNKNNR